MSDNIHILGDDAIINSNQDLFNFKNYAGKIQKFIQHNANNSSPLTIGIYGKWGEGKTSFLNLVEDQIDLFENKKKREKGILKYHFNPWRYTSEDEMIFDFFDGLSKTMFLENSVNLKNVGERLVKFSKYLKSIKISASVGIPKLLGTKVSFEPSEIFKSLGEDLKGEELTLDKLKDKVNQILEQANYKIVVFIDDLDRLDKEEIYTILKLIKLNANFKNFVYIVTLDSEQVAKAISQRYGNDIQDGNLFLEKIINLPIHLPRIEEEDLQYFFETKLSQIKNSLFFLNKDKKQIEFEEIVQKFSGSYYNTPREILKVLNSFFIGSFAIGDEVNLSDLFWIEYLKIKNEDCYNFIKNYNVKGSVILNDTVVDFNDEFLADEKINGTRLKLKEYKDVWKIIEMLFPNRGKIIGLDYRISELRINIVDHYEKYFSYHTYRKVPNVKIFQIEESIKSERSEVLKSLIKDLFNSEYDDYKIFYKIENLVKTLTPENGREFFYKFLFENLEILPESEKDIFGRSYKLRIIETAGELLNHEFENISSDKGKDHNESILSIAQRLNINQLCHFTRKFKDHRDVKLDLEKLIVKETKQFNVQEPFFDEPTNMPNKMIMHVWKKHNKNKFEDYMKASLNNEVTIKQLIRNFAPYWNNSFFGGLEERSYTYMKELLDVDFIYSKLNEFNSKLVNKINPNKYNFSDKDNSSIEENLEQFIYWYKKDKGLQ